MGQKGREVNRCKAFGVGKRRRPDAADAIQPSRRSTRTHLDRTGRPRVVARFSSSGGNLPVATRSTRNRPLIVVACAFPAQSSSRRLPCCPVARFLRGGVAGWRRLRCSPGRKTRPTAPDAAPTILRLERRDIEVNGKSGVGLWHPTAKRDLWPHDRSRQALSRSGRKRHRRTEPDPLAWADAAMAAGRRAGDFRPSDSRGRQRRLRLSLAFRRHVLDALASGAAGAGADDGAAHHPR